MPYLGQSPKETFSAATSQVITGTGATSYSLNTAVSSPEDLEVFINNVQQQPTTTYTVSGSTITFDEALNSTDTCYVIFRGSTKESRTHPAGSSLQAANITASGNATVTGGLTVDTNTLHVDAANNRVGIGIDAPLRKLHIKENAAAGEGILLTNEYNQAGTYSDLKWAWKGSSGNESYGSGLRFRQVDTTHGGQLEFYTDNATGTYTKQMEITETGAIGMPNQPVGYRRNTHTGNGWITLTNTSHNIFDSWYTPAAWQQNSVANTIDDNGRFYAVKTGWYLVTPEIYSTTGSTTTGSYGYANVYKNGSNQFGGHIINYGGDTNDKMNSNSVIVYMTAPTDYIQIGVYVAGNGTFQVYSPYNGYWVRFLG